LKQNTALDCSTASPLTNTNFLYRFEDDIGQLQGGMTTLWQAFGCDSTGSLLLRRGRQMKKSVTLSSTQIEHRRKFLRFLAGSPIMCLTAYAGLGTLLEAQTQDLRSAELPRAVDELDHLGPPITSADQAIDVFDFVPVARKKLPPAHFGHLAGGVDDDGTMRANRAGFEKLGIRPRRLVGVQKIDMSVKLFGETLSSPIFLSPVGGLGAYDPEGEVAPAKAARAKEHLMVMSTGATRSVEDITAARGAPIWYQLYPTDVWEITRTLVKRAEKAGCPVLVLTVDSAGGANRETFQRFRRIDTQQCNTCHGAPEDGFSSFAKQHAMFDGTDISKITSASPPSMNWDLVKRLKDVTSMKLLIKGILTHEDTQTALQNGVDGIIVSNHGGRHVATNRSTIGTLPEVVAAADGKIPILVDSGVRRGTDIFKALALGASAVGIGRAYVFALAAFSQVGVEVALSLLRRELQIAMAQGGTTAIGKITRDFIVAD
jgi:isopentenyl diphosphate isomerase/L-lactate dehydrogenase-like FMN-dependent dehydrogenase